MRDERTGIYRIAGAGAEHHLECCEWADHAQPGLHDYHKNGQQMCRPKPGIPDPRPSKRLAGEDKHQSQQDESDEKRVQQQDCIGSQSK